MYRTVIEVLPDGRLRVAREFSVNPETSSYIMADCCHEMASSHARRLLACAKLIPVSGRSRSFLGFISEEA